MARPFDTLEQSFRLLTATPDPLALDGRLLGHGLPARPIPLDELRRLLLSPSVGFAARDAALTALVARAKTDGGAWMVGLAGLLLPGLRRRTRPLTAACPSKAWDLEAEVLAALMETVAGFPLGSERVAARLVWPAVRAGHRLLGRVRVVGRREVSWGLAVEPPPRLPDHPDFVLARAVTAGVVSAGNAELIAESRLDGVPLRDLAARMGVGYKALCKRRERAERALVGWLVAQRMSPAGGVPAGCRAGGAVGRRRRPAATGCAAVATTPRR